MKAANSAPIKIDGAIFLKLEGLGIDNQKVSCSVMTYISPDANAFFLSKALILLQFIPKDFPKIGSAVISPKPDIAGIYSQQSEGYIA